VFEDEESDEDEDSYEEEIDNAKERASKNIIYGCAYKIVNS